jgi:hypothetical protein
VTPDHDCHAEQFSDRPAAWHHPNQAKTPGRYAETRDEKHLALVIAVAKPAPARVRRFACSHGALSLDRGQFCLPVTPHALHVPLGELRGSV